MPSFSDSFWSNDYSTGLGILFDKLHQGCIENEEVIAIATARADAEEVYGNKLNEIPLTFAARKNGFARDDGASLRKAYDGIILEMGEEGKHHVQVAENIRRMVVVPFGRWADEHRQRVDYSNGLLKSKLKTYSKELAEVQKSQKRYFNKCRVLEDAKDLEGDESIHTNDSVAANAAPVAVAISGTGTVSTTTTTPSSGSAPTPTASPGIPTDVSQADLKSEPLTAVNTTEDQTTLSEGVTADFESSEPLELGDEIYSPESSRALLHRILTEIPQKEVRVAILGTYDHVSSGDIIVSWLQNNVTHGSLALAEKFGQDLIVTGLLRLVGQVGSKFANSSVMNYQWRKKAFVIAGLDNQDSLQSRRDLITPFMGEYIGGTINNYINNTHGDETPIERLKREVHELDVTYKANVFKLDELRCSLEEAVIDHLTFMERCEFDRLRALKSVFLDFIASLSNVVPSIQASVDKQLLFQETVHPANDLRYILESYRTGLFSPKVILYDNYYNSAEDQTFGVDLELRCRVDHKRVPLIVSSVLSHLDSQYPILENDKVRLGAWTVTVPLNSTHQLRKELNTGKPISKEVLSKYEAPIVASVLKLYLVELPDSIVPCQYYDVIKTIYSQHGTDESVETRLNAIQNTFALFRISNIATLDAITTHLARLIKISDASEEYRTQLAQELSHCFLRPRAQSSLTIGDRHAYRLVNDLFVYRERIFPELKRNNSTPRRGGSAKEPASSTLARRATLQNRLEALTLKMKSPAKGAVGASEKELPKEPTSESEKEEAHDAPIASSDSEYQPGHIRTLSDKHTGARNGEILTSAPPSEVYEDAETSVVEDGGEEKENPIVID